MHCKASKGPLTVPGRKQMLKRNGGHRNGEDSGKAGVPGLGGSHQQKAWVSVSAAPSCPRESAKSDCL